MNGSFTEGRSSWRNSSDTRLSQRHTRTSSYNSSLKKLHPKRFFNQIYLPEIQDDSIRDSFASKQYPQKEKLSQRLSLDNYTLGRSVKSVIEDSIYRRNSRSTRSSGKSRGHTRSKSMGNPYSVEEYESESSFESIGPNPYDGPITFTPEIDRRPFPKIPTELRQKLIEQARDSRRDVNANQSRRRSRSHDPSLVTRGYMEHQFSFEIDPDIPGYRPAGRYKKHNPRERKPSNTSREFNIDNYSRYDEDNNNDNGYRTRDEDSRNRDSNKQNSIRNRNREQKVINSILKNKPPNNRSISDTSGDGLRTDNSFVDVFTSNRDRSQSYGPAQDSVRNSPKPNTIYFYQTKL